MRILGALIASSVMAAPSDECFLPIDLMFVQDTTGSFHDDLPNVSKNIPDILDFVEKNYPGSRFGITEFRDKPYRDLAEPDDYCYKLDRPLCKDRDAFAEAWKKLLASGGGDLPESQLNAMINVVMDPEAKWRKIDNTITTPSDDYCGAKLLIVSTDAAPHWPGDYKLWLEPPLPEPPLPPSYMTPYPDDPSAISPDAQCRTYDYPAKDQAAKILKQNNVNVVFFVPQDDQEVVKEWKEFNTKFLGQPDNFVQYIKNDSSDILPVIEKALGAVSQYVCHTTTTTGAPTTAPATTTPAPTTTAATTTSETTTTTTTTSETTTTSTTTPATTTTTSTTTPATTTTAATTTSETTTAATTASTITATAPPVTTVSETTTTATTGPSVTTQGPTQPTTTPATTTPATTAPATTTAPASTTSGPCHCDGDDCPCVPAIVVRVNHRPKSLVIDYDK